MRSLLPPAGLAVGRSLRERLPGSRSRGWPTYEYVSAGWEHERLDPNVTGWNEPAIAAAQRRRWPSFLRAIEGSAPLGVFHEVAGDEILSGDVGAHNLVMSFGYVLALAAGGCERVSVLDWGGGLGHYGVLARALLPTEIELDYHCTDVPLLAAVGSELQPESTFHTDDRCFDRKYDLVLVSAALQYSRDWAPALERLGSASTRYLYVTRLPVVRQSPSFVVLQRAHAAGYPAAYLGWALNRNEFLARSEAASLTLAREFLTSEEMRARGAPEIANLRGFLFIPGEAET